MHTLKPAFCLESKVFAEYNDVPPVLWLNTGEAKPEHVTTSLAHDLESQPLRRVDRRPSSANTRHNASTIDHNQLHAISCLPPKAADPTTCPARRTICAITMPLVRRLENFRRQRPVEED